jgi:hypothetical protein
LIGGWVGTGAALDAAVRRKIPSPCRDSISQSSIPYPIAIPLSYPTGIKLKIGGYNKHYEMNFVLIRINYSSLYIKYLLSPLFSLE